MCSAMCPLLCWVQTRQYTSRSLPAAICSRPTPPGCPVKCVMSYRPPCTRTWSVMSSSLLYTPTHPVGHHDSAPRAHFCQLHQTEYFRGSLLQTHLSSMFETNQRRKKSSNTSSFVEWTIAAPKIKSTLLMNCSYDQKCI